jgi:hypothetical protein
MSTANNAPSRYAMAIKAKKRENAGRERGEKKRQTRHTTRGDEEDQEKKKAVACIPMGEMLCAGCVFPFFFRFLSVPSPSHHLHPVCQQAPLFLL